MIIKTARLFFAVIAALILAGCVTTSSSSFGDKKDLVKAEETYIQIGYGHIQAGNLQDAKRALIRAIDINSKSAGAHLGLARVYDQELEFKLADSHFKKAIRYDETTEIHFQYGVYLYNRGDFKGAYSEFKETLKDTVYPRRALASEYLGVVASRLGKDEVAIESYSRAIALNPMMSNSFIGLTNVYRDQENYPKAYLHYQGFVNLVRSQVARQNGTTLWLGIQLADKLDDQDALYSLVLQLRNQFDNSPEYQSYLKWKAEKDAG